MQHGLLVPKEEEEAQQVTMSNALSHEGNHGQIAHPARGFKPPKDLDDDHLKLGLQVFSAVLADDIKTLESLLDRKEYDLF